MENRSVAQSNKLLRFTKQNGLHYLSESFNFISLIWQFSAEHIVSLEFWLMNNIDKTNSHKIHSSIIRELNISTIQNPCKLITFYFFYDGYIEGVNIK